MADSTWDDWQFPQLFDGQPREMSERIQDDVNEFVEGGGMTLPPDVAAEVNDWLSRGAPPMPPVITDLPLPHRRSAPPTAGMETPDYRIELAPPEDLGTITLTTYDGREIVRYVRFIDRSPSEFNPCTTAAEQLMGYPVRYTNDAPEIE